MIELGHYALCITLILALFQAGVGLWPLRTSASGTISFSGLPSLTALLQVGCIILAWICLTVAYVQSDFSVAVIAGNSHTTKPLLYKITGVWGNHEGSMLLWLFVLTLFGGAFSYFGKHSFTPQIYYRSLGFNGVMGTLFSAFILFTSNPFQRLFPVPLNGNDLNPLLQDIGLAFHPPTLYLGYVGFSMAFSVTIAALLCRQLDSAWATSLRPWVMVSWTTLTAGIALGCWWAYYELGWGGFWFWDPVENASLMPWLAGTALLHTLRIVEKRNALKHWVVLTALMSFSCSLLGTFLVRSGIITSVHAFAASPDRGLFILLILGILVGGSLALYAVRSKDLDNPIPFSLISREGVLILSNLLFTVCLLTVLTGTLAPVVTEALSPNKISVGPPYYNSIFLPLITVLAFLMPFAMRLGWGKGRKDQIQLFLLGITSLTAIGTGIFIFVYRLPWVAYLSFGLGLWILSSVILDLVLKLYTLKIRPPLSFYAMTFSHAGVGLVLLGITGTTLMVDEAFVSIKQGDRFTLGAYSLQFKGTQITNYPNYLAERGIILVSQGENRLEVLRPERRQYKVSGQTTTEADISLHYWGDLYVALGEIQADGTRAIRAWRHPLVSLLWLGLILTVTGGVLALVSSVLKQRKSRFISSHDCMKSINSHSE